MDQATSISITSRVGYDYDFCPPLEDKYECAICLLGLRSPMQTSCGHRFCKDCILLCLREGCGGKCPVDNSLLSESDLFPDSCVEREILQLKVLCPNHSLGCKNKITLMYLENHTRACTYQPVMCPNECSTPILQKELDNHLQFECFLRLTACSLCSQPHTFNQEQVHLMSCIQVPVPCEMCLKMMPRGHLASHIAEVCPKVVVPCDFAEHGCLKKMSRDDLKQHLIQEAHLHLQLLSSAMKKMNTFVSDMSRNVGFSLGGTFSRQPSLASTSSPMVEEPSKYPSQAEPPMEKCHHDIDNNNMDICCAKGNNNDFNLRHKALNLPLNDLHEYSHKKLYEHNNTFPFTKRVLHDLSDKSLDMDQRSVELSIQINNMAKKMEDLSNSLMFVIYNTPGRYCQGNYVWKIENFKGNCQEMLEKGKILHSPPFYSTPFGYKFCIRINVTTKSDCSFLTLYIHMMKGDNDDHLNWPFCGQIKISVLDCSDYVEKQHITETMEATPELQAFRRPDSQRNPKGLGFTEFSELKQILDSPNCCFVKNDVLYIKAVVCSS